MLAKGACFCTSKLHLGIHRNTKRFSDTMTLLALKGTASILRVTVATVYFAVKPQMYLNCYSCALMTYLYKPLASRVSWNHCDWKQLWVRGYRRTVNKNSLTREISFRADVLVQVFGCDVEEANHFLSAHLSVVRMGQSKFNRLVQLFAMKEIPAKELFTYPDVFKRNFHTVNSRFLQLEEAGVERIKLAHINTSELLFQKRLVLQQREKFAREVYQDVPSMLMSCLGCSRQQTAALIEKNLILKDSKLSTLKMKMELLVAQGVTTQMILQKPWVLTLPVRQLETRSRYLRKHHIMFKNSPKSFFNLLKCPTEDLQRLVVNLQSELQVLGQCESKEEFLCRSLHCDPSHISTLKRSYSKILSVKTTKLQATLTFLKECAISHDDIIANGRIFSFSTETLQQRYEQLKDFGCDKISAKLLASDSRVYRKVVEKLKSQIV